MLRGSLPARSTLGSVDQYIQLLDDLTDEPIDLRQFIDIIVTVDSSPHPGYGRGGHELRFSLVNGDITLEPDGLAAHLFIPRSRMQGLAAQTYDIGMRCILHDDEGEFQMMLGKLPIMEGL